jgi:chromosome segregation ATPase
MTMIHGILHKIGLRRSSHTLSSADSTTTRNPAAIEVQATPRRGLFSRFSSAPRDAAALTELRKGYTEVVDMVRVVREHLNQQADRSERLLNMLEHLPRAMETLPETNRNQSRMLEVIQLHLDQQGRQSTKLNEALATLAHASDHASQVMGLIQQQVDSNRDSDQRVLQSFEAMNQTMQRLNDSSQAGVIALRELSQQSDRRMQELIQTNARHMTILSVTSWVLAAIAAAIALYAAWSFH